MPQGKRYDDEFKELAILEGLSTKNVEQTAKDFGVAPSTLYKWIKKYNKEYISEDNHDLFENFLDLIEANHKDLSGYFIDYIYEKRTEDFLKLCMLGIPGFKIYYKDKLKGDKDNANKERLNFFKKFCYLLYELED